MKRLLPCALFVLATSLSPAVSAAPKPPRDLHCTLKFNSENWSVLYEQAEGKGTVTCADGATLDVAIKAKGVGIGAGKWKIESGTGKFTKVRAIDDVVGSYAALSANVGAVKSGTAQVLTNGKVSLALAGHGDGFDIGVAVSDFKIARAPAAAK